MIVCIMRLIHSLRARLLLLFLAALLPAFVLIYHSAVEQHAASVGEVQEHALEIAGAIASEEDNLVASMKQLLMTLVRLPVVRSGTGEAFRTLGAELIRDNPRVHNLARVDLSGNTVASVIPLSKAVNVADRSYFREAVRTGGFAVGDYQIGRITGAATLNFAYPVRDPQGRVESILYAALDLDWLNRQQAVGSGHVPDGATLSRIDRNGTVFAHYPAAPALRGSRLPVPAVLDALGGKAGKAVEAVGPDGIRRLYVVTPIARPGGVGNAYLVFGMPSRLLFDEGDRRMRVRLASLALVALLGGLAAWFGTKRAVLQPIGALLDATRRFGDGDLSARSGIPHGEGELAGLAAGFDRMAEAVEQRERAVREAQRLYRTLVNASPDAITVNDRAGTVVFASRTARRMFGYDPDEAIADRPFLDWVAPEDRAKAASNFESLLREGRLSETEYTLLRRDGSRFVGEIYAAILREEDGSVKGAVVATRDITERKRTVEALRQSDLRLRAAVDNLPFDFWACDADGRYVLLNATALRKYGRNLASLVGKRPDELDVPDEVRRIWMDNNRRALAGELVEREVRVTADGEMRDQLDILSPILDGTEIRGLVGISIDMSGPKAQAEALRKSDLRFRTFIENINDVVFALDRTGTFTYLSPNWTDAFGYGIVESLGSSFERFVHPDDVEPCRDFLRAVLQSGGRRGGVEYRVIRKDGGIRWYSASGAPIADADTGEVSFLGVGRDVTDLKVAEARRAELEAQLRQSQKMEAVGQLAGGIAHDFNNLMTVVLGQVDMVRKRWNDPALADRLAEIGKAGERAATLTRQLLAFSRRQLLQPAVVDLGAVLEDVRAILDRLIGDNYLLEISSEEGLWPVLADPSQIGQVVVNLVVNARDALPDGGTIRISTGNVTQAEAADGSPGEIPPGDYVRLAVRDDGVGMDEATKARLFEPFFTTKEVGKGTGLGLSTVYGIVMQSGGHIRIDSEPGAGTTVEILLPRTEGEASEMTQECTLEDPPQGEGTLLLVEDAGHVREMVRDILLEYGYRVLEAGNGDEALRVAAAHAGPIDLLLTDLVMPGISGRKLAEAFAGIRPDMRVLFMSGYAEEAALRAGIVNREVAFLQKPFTPEALGWKIHEVLSKPKGTA
jgi:PAS domain S-box-containing protein